MGSPTPRHDETSNSSGFVYFWIRTRLEFFYFGLAIVSSIEAQGIFNSVYHTHPQFGSNLGWRGEKKSNYFARTERADFCVQPMSPDVASQFYMKWL